MAQPTSFSQMEARSTDKSPFLNNAWREAYLAQSPLSLLRKVTVCSLGWSLACPWHPEPYLNRIYLHFQTYTKCLSQCQLEEHSKRPRMQALRFPNSEDQVQEKMQRTVCENCLGNNNIFLSTSLTAQEDYAC